MKIMRFFLSAVMVILFVAGSASAHDPVWPGEKLKTLFPEAVSFEQKNLYVSDEQKAAVEKALGSGLQEEDLKPSIYLAVVRATPDSPPKKAAAMMFIDAMGEGGTIEMGVVVDGKGDLKKVVIFENKEHETFSRKEFLSQFEGKKSSDSFRVGSDIASPAGREKTAQAIAEGARRGMLIISEMFKRK